MPSEMGVLYVTGWPRKCEEGISISLYQCLSQPKALFIFSSGGH